MEFTSKQMDLIDKYRYVNTDGFDWWDGVYETFKEDMKAKGIEVDQMYFSGFWNQGDGACFEGWVSDKNLFATVHNLMEPRFNWCWQYAMGDGNSISWKRSSLARYYHERSLAHDYDIAEFEPEPDQEGEIEYEVKRVVAEAFDLRALQDRIKDIVIDYCEQLYRDLEAEYEYLTSDEAIWEWIVGNELDKELEGEDEQDQVAVDAAVLP